MEKVELLLLKLPYVHFFETSLGREEERTFILVRVYAQGICGWGEAVADRSPLYSYETTTTAWHILKDFLVPLLEAESISEPEEFSEKARIFRGHPMAKAGLELALWDLKAKKAGLPLSKLYGGKKREVQSGVSIGIQDSIRELKGRISFFLEQGYKRVKLKIKPSWDIEVLKDVRQDFPDIPLQVDANGAYSPQDFGRLKDLDRFKLLMLEQPFPPYDLWDHSRFQKEIKTPLCLDESILSASSARQALEMGSCRVINIKVGRVGGFVEARKIHDLCQKKGIPVWCGGMLESGIGRAHNIHLATLPNFSLPNDLSASSRYYREDLIEPPLELTARGTIEVPQAPGIGVFPQGERIKRATIARWHYGVRS